MPNKQTGSLSSAFGSGVKNGFGAKSWGHHRALSSVSLLLSFSVGVRAGGGPRPKR